MKIRRKHREETQSVEKIRKLQFQACLFTLVGLLVMRCLQ